MYLNLACCVLIGDAVDVYVTTPLSSSGSFWVQLASAEEAEFLEMVERLQKYCHEEPPTPVFFSPGDICAAQFSDDSCWYRAKVEGITMDKVSILAIETRFMISLPPFPPSPASSPSPFPLPPPLPLPVSDPIFGLWKQREQRTRLPDGSEVRVQNHPFPGLPMLYSLS